MARPRWNTITKQLTAWRVVRPDTRNEFPVRLKYLTSRVLAFAYRNILDAGRQGERLAS